MTTIAAWQRRGPTLLVLAATATAAVLTSRDLGARPLWLDETVSVEAAFAGLRSVLRMFRTIDGNMLLYHLVLLPWIRVFGDGETAVRSLSALCAIVTIPVVARLGRRLLGAWPGALGAAVLATNPFFLAYGREARGYALEVLLIAAAALALERARDDDLRRDWAAWAVCAGLAPAAHILSVLPLGVHALAVWWDGQVDRRRFAGWGLVAAAIASPIVIDAVHLGPAQIAWVPVPGLPLVYRVLRSIAGGSEPAMWVLHGLTWALGLGTLFRPGARGVRVVAALAILPMLSAYVFSLVATPIFLPRYMLMTAPGWALLAGAGLWRVRTPLLALLVWVAIVHPWYDPRSGPPWIEDWRSATAWLADAARPGDVAIPWVHFADIPFGYHHRQVAPGLDLPVLRLTHAQVTVGGLQPPPDLGMLARVTATHDRIWLVMTHSDVPGGVDGETALVHALTATHEPIRSADFPGVRLRLYRTKGMTGDP